ncbi:DUF6420 family protein, partial [Streptomyces spectabilis]|uniref:DUF6420 family protein n=1 Tax=Streptomyces spectabilis TaxID=68270 RepID=UPI0033E49688
MHDSGGPRLGPYIQFDGLPPLYRPETALPLAHPYGPVRESRRRPRAARWRRRRARPR